MNLNRVKHENILYTRRINKQNLKASTTGISYSLHGST